MGINVSVPYAGAALVLGPRLAPSPALRLTLVDGHLVLNNTDAQGNVYRVSLFQGEGFGFTEAPNDGGDWDGDSTRFAGGSRGKRQSLSPI